MKDRWIIPICKIRKKANDAQNFRPISLTSYIMKVLEKVLCYRLVNYMMLLKLLSKSHYGYMRARSTQDSILYIVDNIMRNYRKKNECFQWCVKF